jgi:hypothetical protein
MPPKNLSFSYHTEGMGGWLPPRSVTMIVEFLVSGGKVIYREMAKGREIRRINTYFF